MVVVVPVLKTLDPLMSLLLLLLSAELGLDNVDEYMFHFHGSQHQFIRLVLTSFLRHRHRGHARVQIRDLCKLIGMGQEDVPRGQVHVDYALPLQIIHAVCYLQHRVSLNDKTVLLANR